jgi:hypothetical protein
LYDHVEGRLAFQQGFPEFLAECSIVVEGQRLSWLKIARLRRPNVNSHAFDLGHGDHGIDAKV